MRSARLIPGREMDLEDLEKQHSWLKRRARRLMGSRLRAWMESGDLAQETEREALHTIDGKRFPNLAAFRGWLLKILCHHAANESRRRGLDLVDARWSRMSGNEPSLPAALPSASVRWCSRV